MRTFVFFLSIVFCLSCHRTPPKEAAPLEVEVYVAAKDTVPNTMRFVGQVYSNYDAVIQPRVSGYLTEINYTKGMPVRKGQLLYKIDPTLIATAVEAARAQVASASAALVEAENNYRRAVPLAAMNAISQSMLDQYQALSLSAQATLRSARSNLVNASSQLGYNVIRSPIDGIIGDTDLALGEYVGVGTNFATLNTVASIDSVRVRLALPVNQYLKVRAADSLTSPAYANRALLSNIRLTLSDGSVHTEPGVYQYTEQSVSSSTGTIVLNVVFPNPGHALKPGQYAEVTADVGAPQRLVLVPQRCVVQSQGVDAVWVVGDGNKVSYRKVTLGDTQGSLWVVLDGLAEGERVLTEGGLKVQEGMEVKVKDSK